MSLVPDAGMNFCRKAWAFHQLFRKVLAQRLDKIHRSVLNKNMVVTAEMKRAQIPRKRTVIGRIQYYGDGPLAEKHL